MFHSAIQWVVLEGRAYRGLRVSALLGALLVGGVVLGASANPARAQTSAPSSAQNKAAAEALFDQALTLLRNEQFADACQKLEQSQRIDPAVGTLLYLAECYERMGRVASAWATFREASSAAAAMGQPERAKVGAERAQKLEGRLSRVTFDPGANAKLEGFVLEREGVAIAPAVFGVPVPVDPGVHTLSASAPGHEPWQLQLSVPEQPSTQTVTIPALTQLPEAVQPVTTPAPSITPVVPDPISDQPPAIEPRPDYTWAWVSAGVGVVGIGAGVAMGVRAKNFDEDAKRFCTGNLCFDRRGERASEDAQRSALFANIGYGVGAAGLITAAVLVVFAEPEDPLETAKAGSGAGSIWLAPDFSTHGGGVAVQGAF